MGERFEEAVRSAVGTKHAIAVNSGTSALIASLLAHDIGAGDEVLTSPFTFVATLNAILHVGASPRFVDIGEDFNLDAGAGRRRARTLDARRHRRAPVRPACGHAADRSCLHASGTWPSSRTPRRRSARRSPAGPSDRSAPGASRSMRRRTSRRPRAEIVTTDDDTIAGDGPDPARSGPIECLRVRTARFQPADVGVARGSRRRADDPARRR